MCDNQTTIRIANNTVHHDRTKHIEADSHFISEKVDKKFVNLIYVSTRLQVADILTNALYKPTFDMIQTRNEKHLQPSLSLRGSVEDEISFSLLCR